MTRYKIPENILPGFKIITQLNENQLNELSIILKTLDSKLFGENDQKGFQKNYLFRLKMFKI